MQQDDVARFFSPANKSEGAWQQRRGVPMMETRWLKHRINGVVHLYDDILASSPDMLECDKDGKPILSAGPRIIEQPIERVIHHSREGTDVAGTVNIQNDKTRQIVVEQRTDESQSTLEVRIAQCRDLQDLTELALSVDAGIAPNQTLEEAKANFIAALPEIREHIREQGEKSAADAKARLAKAEADRKAKDGPSNAEVMQTVLTLAQAVQAIQAQLDANKAKREKTAKPKRAKKTSAPPQPEAAT